jgi:serine/threonine protein phosphatase PrpC
MPLQQTNLGYILAISRRGASHYRNNIPCQDAYALETQTISDKTAIALAVADGHGDAQHDLSEHGAKIAVKLAIQELLEFFQHFYCEENSLSLLNRNFKQNFPRHIGRCWRKNIWQDAKKRLSSFTETDKNEKTLKRYGTTLLTALILPNCLLLGQIGDGNILRVFPNGQIEEPFNNPTEIISNYTDSLCLESADKLWQTATLARIKGESLLLATDGLSNAFIEKSQFHTFANSLFARINEFGIKSVAAALPHWLNDYSEKATGDDITLLIFKDI